MNDQFSLKYPTNKLCIIISQEVTRSGGIQDRKRLTELFKNLQFKVVLIEDYEKEECPSIIKRKCENGDIGLLVVFVLCHKKDLTQIEKIFSSFTVENLKTIPKLFFFQACRGKNYEKGYFTDLYGKDSDGGIEAKDVELIISKLPNDANTLLSFSSISGSKSFRVCWGSYFIYLIYQVFIAHSEKWDVVTMLTLVHRLIATKLMYGNASGEKIMQMPSFKSRLTKKVFLTNNKLSLQCGPFYVDDKIAVNYKEDEICLYNLAKHLKLTKNDLMCEDKNIYPVKDDPGLCLIFEKNMNTKTMIKRIGSNKDADNLNKLFTMTLGFKVKMFTNFNKNQILTTLTAEMADKELMTKITNFVVIVLTHGDNEEVCQDDKQGQKSLVDDFVLEMKECAEIREIPKIILIQADNLDLNKILECRNEGVDNGDYGLVDHDGKHLPSEANILYMYSNVPARSDEDGTPLVKHFCETVSQGLLLDNDLLSILTVVNRKISEEIMKGNSEILASPKIPFFVSQLIRKVVLRRNKFQV